MQSELELELRQKRFEEVFDRDRRVVLGYALRRVDRPADAADIVAETFLTAWRRLDQVPADNPRPWLLGVARKVLANHHRGEGRHRALAEKLGGELEAQLRGSLAYTQPGEGELGPATEALMSLSDADREVLELAVWEELKPAEIAVVLGIGRISARSRLHRARGRLRSRLEQADPDLPEPRRAPAAGTHPLRDPATGSYRDLAEERSR